MADEANWKTVAAAFLLKVRTAGPRTARVVGAAVGSIMPRLDASQLDRNDPVQRAFAAGLEGGKNARNVGDLLVAATQDDDTTEEKDEPT